MGRFADIVARVRRINLKDSLSSLRHADVLLFCHDADRGVALNGKAYSPLLDSIRDDLVERGYTCTTVALQFSRVVGDAAHGSPHAMNRSYLLASLASRAGQLVGVLRQGREPVVRLFERMLDSTRPLLVLSIGSSPELAAACRRKHIRHAEIIHGTGYTTIPWRWGSYPADFLPSDIVSFDAVSTKTFSPLQEKGVRLHHAPNPYLGRFFKKGATLPEEWLAPPPEKQTSHRRRVLVPLNWGYSGDHGQHKHLAGLVENGLFPETITQLVDETAEDVFWSFRLHPVQMRQPQMYGKIIAWLTAFCDARTNAEFTWASEVPLPVALRGCEAVVTMQSMTVYQAAAMGIRSLVLCPTTRAGGVNAMQYEELVESGHVTKAEWDIHTLRDWLNADRHVPPLDHSSGCRTWDVTWRDLLGTQEKSTTSV